MFKKHLLTALAIAGLSFGTLQALSLSGLTFNSTSVIVECTGGGSESFSNIPASSSAYSTRTWTGDNGVAWSATDARTDQTLTGKAIAMRTGTLKNTSTVTGGVGTLTFDYQRVFTGNSTLKVFVNGVQYGGDITVSSTTATTFSQAINVAGNVTIEIKNSGNRTIIDNLSWTCSEGSAPAPELQIADASNNNQECGTYTLDFGSHPINQYQDAVFTVKNTGSATLNVSALNLSNTTDYTIISPSVPFSVTAGGSAIVLVRFDAVTGGEKTSTLTVVSNDANEGECVVNLTGIGMDVCTTPSVDNSTITVSEVTSSTATVAIDSITADFFLAVVTTAGSLSSIPVDTVNYAVNDSIGGGLVVYVGNDADFTISGLNDETTYTLFVFPYNNINCTRGPLYNITGLESSFSTPVAPCIGGNETFVNMPANSSAYSTRTWTGDNGIEWTATDARTDQTLTDRAIAIRTGSLTNTVPVSGGIDTLSFDYKRVFTGNSTLKVFVNGIQYGGDITVSSETATTFIAPIEVEGDVMIEIENSGNRTIVDNLSWNCYTAPDRPEIQLFNSNLSPLACGASVNLGNIEVNAGGEAFFTIKNNGLQPLEVSSVSVSDTANYEIVDPVSPVTIPAQGTYDVYFLITATTTGVKPATIIINSNDADEAACTVDITANVLDACAAPEVAAGDVIVSNPTSSSVDVTVEGLSADGYIAVISTGGVITAPSNGVVYQVNDTIDAGTVAYVGTSATFTIGDLDPETTYTIFVYPYNTTDCIGGPIYSASALETSGTTTAVPCVGGNETFTDMPANSSAYATRTWTGDNGVEWTATDARTDQQLTNRAIAIRLGNITNTTPVSGGIGTISFNYKRVFSGNSTLKVFVNGVQYGSDIAVTSETPANFTQVINVTGDVTVAIENAGNRVVIDDITWDCYSGISARPAAQPVKTSKVNNEVKLYPNPSNGQFQLDLVTETADVAVYNTIGKEVLRKTVSDNETIDLGKVEAGIYMVVIASGNNVSTQKVVIK